MLMLTPSLAGFRGLDVTNASPAFDSAGGDTFSTGVGSLAGALTVFFSLDTCSFHCLIIFFTSELTSASACVRSLLTATPTLVSRRNFSVATTSFLSTSNNSKIVLESLALSKLVITDLTSPAFIMGISDGLARFQVFYGS
ncbi:hypothetical protein OGAPHI_000633 [Ogataea philodendri]|uniref:Uncharacterized protein n=1 Tax=Ogataea philodendri TaxID=1378263 RepID=A0A9P8PF72_9ASCO|nr:uncharacterized protein OGAPHI_000633 [Ogataea philodendri]KAH3670922.1 hypothetical protein OGAPHI_000633 [Ogataea philodendri]